MQAPIVPLTGAEPYMAKASDVTPSLAPRSFRLIGYGPVLDGSGRHALH